jgi:hypothetical protein
MKMQSEFIVVAGTLLGVFVGGSINFLSNRSAKNHEWRLAIAREKASSRLKLYAEFLVEAQRLVVQAIENKTSSLSDFNLLNAKFAEVSLVAPEPMVEIATALADHALTSHAAKSAKETVGLLALKAQFVAAARADVEQILTDA